MQTIRSRQHPLVADFRAAARSSRSDRRHILLTGTRLVNDARCARVPIEMALFSASALAAPDSALHALAAAFGQAGTRMLAATESVMRAVDPLRSPAGVVALAPYRPAALEQLDDAWRSGLVIAAVQVQDPGNVGAIIRTVDAGGGAGVVTTDDSADPFGWRALRGAMGSTFRIPVATCPDMQALIRRARGRGAAVVAAVPHGGVAPDRTDLVRPTLALLGAEGGGLDRGLDDTADVRVSIPMRRTVDSLNVAVAAGVLVYEARRQRAAAASGGRA